MKKKCAVGYAVPNRISEGLWAYRIIDCGAAKDIYRETKESTYKLRLSISLFQLSINCQLNKRFEYVLKKVPKV